MELQDLNTRFSDVNTELLSCAAALNPKNGFSCFVKDRLVRTAQHPNDFSFTDCAKLDIQLEMYITDVSSDEDFIGLNGIAELGPKMVETGKSLSYPLVYYLLKLAYWFYR